MQNSNRIGIFMALLACVILLLAIALLLVAGRFSIDFLTVCATGGDCYAAA